MESILTRACDQLRDLLPNVAALGPQVERLGQAMMTCWQNRGKVLIAGNGGSAADAMHFAEELVVRFQKNRRGLAAMALCDPTILTCAANDLGYEQVFARQVEAFGNPGDVFVAMTTSGNSANLLKAIRAARERGLVTAGFLGKDGGQAKGLCDIELLVPSPLTARVQEAHLILYHSLCEWVEARV
ncbi:MAG TPA: SIS domain-containing protein [Tepidisphaeraceae bacterium]|jgi:D-sedoheptulose 7-phosphate isomerase